MKKLFLIICILSTLHLLSQNNLTTSLSACYALNGNANEPINNLTGTLSAVTPTVDRFNNPNSAYQFAGNGGSYIELPNSALLKSNSVSFSAWVKTNFSNNSQYIVFTNNNCGSYHEGYMLALLNIGTNQYRLQAVKSHTTCSSGGQIILNANSNISSNTWCHVGLYVGNDSIKVYLNGVLDGALANSNPINYNPIKNVYLGGSNLGVNIPFSGTIDNVRFYNRKLSGTEFNQLYIQDPSCAVQAVGLAPVVAFSVSAVNICAGKSISMTDASANNPTAWNWQIPGAVPPTAAVSNPTISFPTPGNYIVSLVSSNTVGASNTATQSIVVLPNPIVLAVANNTSVCIGQSTNLFASGANSYSWSTQQTGLTINVSPLINTVYTLTGTDNNGCINTGTVEVLVKVTPTVNISSSALSVCNGNSITLTAGGANSYTWNTNQTGSSIIVFPTGNTFYSVTGLGSNNCTATASITVNVNPIPSLTITTNQTTVCRGQSINLTASGAATYTWNNNQNGAVINLSPINSSTYGVMGFDGNGCQNSTAITIFVDPCVGIEKFEKKSLVEVYPNPSNGYFTLNFGKENTGNVFIMNTLSEIIYQAHFENEVNLKLDLTQQKSGIYFLKLKMNGKIYTKKIIKE